MLANMVGKLPWLLAIAAVGLTVAGLWGSRGAGDQASEVLTAIAPLPERAEKTFTGEAGDGRPAADVTPSSPQLHATRINRPSGPPRIELTAADPAGRVGSVACSTCHSIRPPEPANRTPADLDEFHQQMPMNHGQLACLACHNPQDYDTLRLADGTAVAYPDVMTLCAQCHGPQAEAYAHGAHGGMNGYWDLSRGPRTRNNCVDCHDPHAPAFPSMLPTFKPRDRFLPDSSHPHAAAAEGDAAPAGLAPYVTRGEDHR